MPLLLHMEKIEKESLILKGEISLSDLNMESGDDLIKPAGPLAYDIVVKQDDESITMQGSLKMLLQCECSRCLQQFEHKINQKSWNCKISLKGEDSMEIIHGTADLTPYLREYTFLAFPQHPLCENGCEGINQMPSDGGNPPLSESSNEKLKNKNVWVELDKLNLD